MPIERVQIVAIVVSVGLLLTVLEFVRRKRLVEEYAFVWIAGAATLLLLALVPELMHTAARMLGVYYPPMVLLLVMIGTVFVALLSFSVILSRQRRQIERLTEEAAILDAELRELREDLRSYRSPKRPA